MKCIYLTSIDIRRNLNIMLILRIKATNFYHLIKIDINVSKNFLLFYSHHTFSIN